MCFGTIGTVVLYCGWSVSTDVFLANRRTESKSSHHSKFWSSIKHILGSDRSTPLAPTCPPYYRALASPCPIAGLLLASRPSEEHLVTTGWRLRSPAILAVVRDVPTLPRSFQDRSLFGHKCALFFVRLTYRMPPVRIDSIVLLDDKEYVYTFPVNDFRST